MSQFAKQKRSHNESPPSPPCDHVHPAAMQRPADLNTLGGKAELVSDQSHRLLVLAREVRDKLGSYRPAQGETASTCPPKPSSVAGYIAVTSETLGEAQSILDEINEAIG